MQLWEENIVNDWLIKEKNLDRKIVAIVARQKKKKKNLDKEIMDIVVVLPFEHINFSSSKFKTNAFIDVDLT